MATNESGSSECEDFSETSVNVVESKQSSEDEFELDSEVLDLSEKSDISSLNDLSSIIDESGPDFDSDKSLSSFKSTDRSQSELETENNEELVELLPAPEVRLHQSQRQARQLIRNGEKNAAITEYIRCLALARIVYGENHWCLAQAHMILAENYLDLMNYVCQALEHGEKAKKIILLWKQPPQTLKKKRKFVYVLVNIYLVLGRTHATFHKSGFSAADKHLERAKKLSLIYIESIGNCRKANILKCKICVPTAKLLFDQQMYTEAIVEYKEALSLLEDLGRGNTIAMVSTHQYLGRCYQKMGDYSNAEERFNLAINLSDEIFGNGSEAAIESMLLLAQNFSLMKTDSADEFAENILRNVIDGILSAKDYYSNLDMQAVDMLFSILISSAGREQEAKELLQHNLPKKCKLFGQASCEVILTLRLLGSLCLTLDEPEEAAKYLRKSYDREVILYGSNHSRVKNTRLALDIVCQSSSVSKKYRVSTPLSTAQGRPRFVLQ